MSTEESIQSIMDKTNSIMIKLSDNAKMEISAMINWYNLSPKKVKNFNVNISEPWGYIRIWQNYKAVIFFDKKGQFSYEGQPKQATQVLCNFLNDKELVASLNIII
jgi:hypothetical protein